MKSATHGLDTLLDLDGIEIELADGRYFVKFEACRTEPSAAVPHGVKYSLTLHERSGRRLLGFDNAHPIKVKRGRFVERPVEADHWHYGPGEEVRLYRFESPGKLVEDFWLEVERFVGIEE